VVAVADYQAAAGLIGPGCQLGYVLVDFGLQRRGQHPAGALPDNLVDQGTGLGRALVVDRLLTPA
jgi:hypothetical protein